jgi:hypothetical protein
MKPESWNSNGTVNIFPRKRTSNNRRAVFSVVLSAAVGTIIARKELGCAKETSYVI